VKRIPLAEHPNKRKLKSRQPHCAVYENELQRVWPTPGTTQRLPGNFFLFQHSYLAAYDFDSARNFAAQQIMKTPTWKKWRAKLLAVMRTRVTLLQNWRAKLISLLLATTVWYLIKKNIETAPSPFGKSLRARVTETR